MADTLMNEIQSAASKGLQLGGSLLALIALGSAIIKIGALFGQHTAALFQSKRGSPTPTDGNDADSLEESRNNGRVVAVMLWLVAWIWEIVSMSIEAEKGTGTITFESFVWMTCKSGIEGLVAVCSVTGVVWLLGRIR